METNQTKTESNMSLLDSLTEEAIKAHGHARLFSEVPMYFLSKKYARGDEALIDGDEGKVYFLTYKAIL